MPITHNSLASLQDSVDSLIRGGDLETPLEMIQAFVERIVSDPLATGRVFSAPALDELCLRLGAQVLSQSNVVTPAPSEGRIVYVATEFYRVGGHTLVAADIVRNLPDREHVFLLTDVLTNPHRDAPDLRLVPLGAKVEIAPTGPRLEKLKWLLARLFELAPEKIYWFNHHQDAVAIAAAQPAIPGDKYFIHHGDHNLCLGVHTPHLHHVDLANLGYFNCRDVLGIANNQYWPLVCDDLGQRDRGRRFIQAGRLRTCSSGGENKFEVPYLYNYADVLARVLSATGGDHVHVGFLSEEYLERIRRQLAEADIPQERFVHVSWVPSLWRALIERGVDVYLMSWPIGGGRALIEAMGAGIPSVIHMNYISRYHGGFDVGYADALTWRTSTELADLLGAFTPESLAVQSLSARAHYEKHHTPEILASLLRGDAGTGPAPIPLRDYHPDRLQIFLDERAQHDAQIANLNQAVAERDGQIASLSQAVAERDGQIAALKLAVAARDGTILAIESSLSWRLTRPLRRAFGRSSPLGIVGRRAAKLVWWVLTLQLPKRMREWQLSRSAKCAGEPHFAPPSDDYCFAIPFDYPIEKPTVTPNVAVVCHMYYPEMLKEFKRYLSNIPFPFDLFITTDSEEKKNVIASGLLDWNKGAVEIRLAPNRGRDIAPKLISCRDVYDRYEFFLHIHSKKSPHADAFAGWRAYLLKSLLGSERIVESIFEAFNSDPRLGMIAPEHYDPVRGSIGWGGNFDAARKFAARLGLKLSIDGKVDFPSGSMFWGRSAAIMPLLESRLTIEDFPLEGSQIDGTLGHVIERIYFFVCEQAGYRWLKIVCPTLLKNVKRIIFIESKASLVASIKEAQYVLLVSSKERASGLFKLGANLGSVAGGVTQSWQTVHAKSDLRTMEFSQFCEELEKHISKQESRIDFDENFYLAANPDIAEEVVKGGVSCGYVHYCLAGQYEGRIHSDRQLNRRFSINPSYPRGFLAPVDRPPSRSQISLAQLSQSPHPILLILFAHLQEDLFFAGYSEFFKDYSPIFDRFDRVIIAVAHAEFDRKIALRYSSRIEVIHLSEIGSLKYKPDIIVGFNAHLTCVGHQLLPDNPERVVYYCQEFESGFYPYGADYIIGEKAIAGSRNLIISTEFLRKFLVNRGLVNNQQVFVTRPNIEPFDVPEVKTNRLFFYYRPESFHERNLPEALMQAVYEFCYKYSGYEIYMVGSVATSYSFKINGTQVYVINKLPKKDYVELISSCDVVISMIYAAHPGVIAFQAAASGIPTITNVFENRDASLLKKISTNIVPYDPLRDNLLDAIEEALAMPKGRASFDETLYSENQQGSLADFHDNILLHRASSVSH